MASFWSSDSMIGIYGSVVIAAVSGAAGWIGSRLLRRQDVAVSNAAAVLQSWRELTEFLEVRNKTLQEMLDDHEQTSRSLRAEVAECERRGTLDRRRIAELELRLGIDPPPPRRYEPC